MNSIKTFSWTKFPDVFAKTKTDMLSTGPEFFAMLRNPETHASKDACPLLTMGTFGDQHTKAGSMRYDENLLTVTFAVGDYDGGQLPMAQARDTLSMWGLSAVFYTTANYTPDHPRWRMLMPLSCPHAPGALYALVARANGILGGILDGGSFDSSRSYFYGRVSGVAYEVLESEGQYIDEAAWLDAGAIGPARALAKVDAVDDRLMLLPALDDVQMADVKYTLRHLVDSGWGGARADWISVGMALKSAALNGREPELMAMWLDFSRASAGFKDDDDVLKKWAELPGTKTGIGAIFNKASSLGMVNPATTRSAANDPAMSDVLISRKLADMLAGDFLYEHGGRGWLTYDRGVWRACTMGEEVEAGKLLGPLILKEQFKGADDARRAMALANRAMSATGIAAALKLAQSDHRLAVRPDDFDRDPELLNCANGVVHLPTGTLRPHDPALRLARQCPYDYAPHAGGRWLKFLDEISLSDPNWIDYLHRVCGYVLTGHVREEVLIFMLGFGANGKSVFANVLSKLMGNYAVSLPSAFLMASGNRNGEAATPALAMLAGARLALANEVESGARLSAQTVKVACSTEPIAARHMYGSVFSFIPTHKLVIRGNHKPIITDDDDGIWRRIHLLPFDRRFGPDEKDMGLEGKLMAEGSGILYWMVQGAVEWFRRGLTRTGRVATASAAYRKESDLMAQWIEDETEQAPEFDCLQGEAYANYVGWCGMQGLRAMCKKQFTDKLKERGLISWQQSAGLRARGYRGFRLKDDFSQSQNEIDLFQ
jgi:putative DNA primase/helicase